MHYNPVCTKIYRVVKSVCVYIYMYSLFFFGCFYFILYKRQKLNRYFDCVREKLISVITLENHNNFITGGKKKCRVCQCFRFIVGASCKCCEIHCVLATRTTPASNASEQLYSLKSDRFSLFLSLSSRADSEKMNALHNGVCCALHTSSFYRWAPIYTTLYTRERGFSSFSAQNIIRRYHSTL